MLDVKYVVCDDWSGLYINNILVDECHNIPFRDGFTAICKHINEVESVDNIQFTTYGINQGWMEDNGSLPKNFEDIPSDLLDEWEV